MKKYDYNFDMDEVEFNGNIIDNTLFVDWVILHECNYKCSYCFGQSPIDKANFVPLAKLKHAVDLLLSIDKEKYVFTITGGEVTYYPYLFEFIDYIFNHNKNISAYIITNGSKNLDFFDKFFQKYENYNVTFTISIHLEYAKYEHISDIIKLSNKYNKRIRLSLMLHPEKQKEAEFFYNNLVELRKEYIFDINLGEIAGGPKFDRIDERYTEEYFNFIDNSLDYINNTTFDKEDIKKVEWGPQGHYRLKDGRILRTHWIKSFRKMQKKFTGFYCCGGINVIRIERNGSYSGGVCSDLKNVGNIYTDSYINYRDLLKYAKCNSYQCTCTANDCIPKFRNEQDAINYTSEIKQKYLFSILSNINNIGNDVNSKMNKLLELSNKIDNLYNKIVDLLAWWIPIKKVRNDFRSKFKL